MAKPRVLGRWQSRSCRRRGFLQVLEEGGAIATGLALVAIVVGGLMVAFGEGVAKRTLAGVFCVGMAVVAVKFMSWLFP